MKNRYRTGVYVREFRFRGALSTGPGKRIVVWAAAFLLLGLVGTRLAIAQCDSPLSLSLEAGIEVFRVADFDPSDVSFHPHVFTLNMCNNLTSAQQVVLSLAITKSSSSGEEDLATGETGPFELAPGTTTLTNRDLTAQEGKYKLHNFMIKPGGEELKKAILDTGLLPQGEYCFKLTMTPVLPGDFAPGEANECLTVENPTQLELLRPGEPFGSEPSPLMSGHPQFQWASRAHAFHFEIAQVESGDASGEDVMERRPVYSDDIDVGARGAPGGIISFTYPSSAGDLKSGHTYCWQVTAKVQTSGGEESIPSQIYCFRRLDPSDLGATSGGLSQFFPELARLLGDVAIGMAPTGEIMIDGKVVDEATVREIIEGLESGRLEITSKEVK